MKQTRMALCGARCARIQINGITVCCRHFGGQHVWSRMCLFLLHLWGSGVEIAAQTMTEIHETQ